MAGCDVVIPEPSDVLQVRAFTAIVESMISLNKVLLCRFIARSKTEPKLVVLHPHIGSNGALLYLNYLPTVEDIRDYQFDSLQKCNDVQLEAMSKFIDHMDLDANEEREEILKPTETYNPILQYFYQCLEYRALKKYSNLNLDNNKEGNNKFNSNKIDDLEQDDDNDNELPEMDDKIKELLTNPSKELFESNPYNNILSKVFRIQKKEYNNINNNKKKRVFWRDIISKDIELGINENYVEKKLEEDNKNKKNIVNDISMLKPIDDFREMINYKYEDLTEKALEKMKNVIIKLINESFKGSFYIKAIDCVKELREQCDIADEVELFNNFMNELLIKFPKEKFIDFWRLIIDSNLTLISNLENIKSLISKEEANTWIKNLENKPINNSTVDLDELINDII